MQRVKRECLKLNNFLSVKCKYKFVVILKTIEYKKDVFYYLFSYINYQAFLYSLLKT